MRLFREEQHLHEEQLAHYEEIRAWLEGNHGRETRSPDSPWFADYAALRRGIGYEKEYTEWCRWMAESLERLAPPEKEGREGARL